VTRRVVWLFPGQGAQRPGMGAPWRQTPSWAVVEEISDAVGRDVGALLLHADADALRETDAAQLSCFALAMVVVDALGPDPDLVACAGHSLGEFSALAAAGVLPLRDAARLVAARGAAMRVAARDRPGTMAVLVGTDAADGVDAWSAAVRAEGHEVWAANHNGPAQVVIAGTPDGVRRVGERVPPGTRVLPIAVAGAFHTPLMGGAAGALAEALAAADFRTGAVPVVSNVDGNAHRGGARWRTLGLDQLTSPVRWDRVMATLTGALGATHAVESGPGRVLAGLLRTAHPALPVRSVRTPADLPAAVGP